MHLRVLLVDDSRLVLESLAADLSAFPDVTVVGTASSGHRALRVLGSVEVDVALLDMNMPRMNGLEALALIRELHPEVKVLVLTSHADMSWVVPALRAGAQGYVLKTSAVEELVDSIRAVARDARPITAAVLDAVLATHAHPDAASSVHLSPRELDTLRHLGRGLSSEAIAKAQHLSLSAVKKALASINLKLGTHNRTQAVAEGVRLGMIAMTRDG